MILLAAPRPCRYRRSPNRPLLRAHSLQGARATRWPAWVQSRRTQEIRRQLDDRQCAGGDDDSGTRSRTAGPAS